MFPVLPPEVVPKCRPAGATVWAIFCVPIAGQRALRRWTLLYETPCCGTDSGDSRWPFGIASNLRFRAEEITGGLSQPEVDADQ